MIIVDTTALIGLAKIGKIGLLRDLFREVLMTPAVRAEALERGRQRGAIEVALIQQAVDQGWLRTARLTEAERQAARDLMTATRLHSGEAESLAMATERKLVVVLDESEARLMARARGVDRIGTARVLLDAFTDCKLSFRELEEAVKELTTVLWISPSVVTEILQTAREAAR